jgi:hypothetical protein
MVSLPMLSFKVIQSSLLEVKEASFCLLRRLLQGLVAPLLNHFSEQPIAQQESLQMATRPTRATI